MKFLVTGASGGLAAALLPVLAGKGHTVLPADVQPPRSPLPGFCPLDIADFAAVRSLFESGRPDFALHLAAATDVDRCETEPDLAYRVNALGTENIAIACRRAGIPMLYISTGEVFDGNKPAPYTEFDPTGPVNVYAKSKLAGENAVQAHLKDYFIVRTAWLVSGGRDDRKFVGKIVRLLDKEVEIRAVDDKFGSPTFAADLAANLLPLIEGGRAGLYHLCNRGSCSRFDMARKIVELLGKKAKVVPVSSEDFQAPAPRGRSEALANYKLDLLGLNRMPAWEESLKAYLKQF